LSLLIDIAGLLYAKVASTQPDPFNFNIKNNRSIVDRRIDAVQTDNEQSWLALLSKLGQLQRTNVFDNRGAQPIAFKDLIRNPSACYILFSRFWMNNFGSKTDLMKKQERISRQEEMLSLIERYFGKG
jgi:hypothetical protein